MTSIGHIDTADLSDRTLAQIITLSRLYAHEAIDEERFADCVLQELRRDRKRHMAAVTGHVDGVGL